MKRAFTLVELTVVVAIIVILAAILLPVFQRTHCSSPGSSCRINLRQIARAWRQYADDYERTAPTISTNGAFWGWSDALAPYGAPAFSICPQSRALPGANPTTPGFSDYYLNSRLSGISLTGLKFPAQIVAFGEGANGDARYCLSHLPMQWREAPNSPARRHSQGANYAFADEHVRWLKPAQISRRKPSVGKPTFLIR